MRVSHEKCQQIELLGIIMDIVVQCLQPKVYESEIEIVGSIQV